MTDEVRDWQTVHGLGRWAKLVVDTFIADNQPDLDGLPSTVRESLIVEATIAYLIGGGLVVPAPPGEPGLHPILWRDAIPEHLHPDVASAVARHARMVALLGKLDGPTDRSRP